MGFRTTVAMRSEKGPVREKNEDCMGLLQSPDTRHGVDAVYVVADGLGGHEKGEVASAMAVELLLGSYRRSEDADQEHLSSASLEPSLVQVLHYISQVICDVGLTGESMHRNPQRPGMATTLTVAVLAGDSLYLGHVGDSRAYLLRRDMLTQLTEDHTVVAEQVRRGILRPEEARDYPSNVLTQAVGLEQPIAPFTTSLALEEGDCLLLCSDGLHGFLDDQAIARTIQKGGDLKAVDSLIADAIAAGSTDNITAMLVCFTSPESPTQD